MIMIIPFLSLKGVTAKYADEIHEAVLRVVDSGWYPLDMENACLNNIKNKYNLKKYIWHLIQILCQYQIVY